MQLTKKMVCFVLSVLLISVVATAAETYRIAFAGATLGEIEPCG